MKAITLPLRMWDYTKLNVRCPSPSPLIRSMQTVAVLFFVFQTPVGGCGWHCGGWDIFFLFFFLVFFLGKTFKNKKKNNEKKWRVFLLWQKKGGRETVFCKIFQQKKGGGCFCFVFLFFSFALLSFFFFFCRRFRPVSPVRQLSLRRGGALLWPLRHYHFFFFFETRNQRLWVRCADSLVLHITFPQPSFTPAVFG